MLMVIHMNELSSDQLCMHGFCIPILQATSILLYLSSHVFHPNFKCADTPPPHTHTQNDLQVAMHLVYLLLLIVELFCYVDEQNIL